MMKKMIKYAAVEKERSENRFILSRFFKECCNDLINELFEVLNENEKLIFHIKKKNTLFVKTSDYFRIKNNSFDFIVYFKKYEFLHNINNEKQAFELIDLIDYSLKNFF